MANLIKGTGSLPVFPPSTIKNRFGELGDFDLNMALEGNAIVLNTSRNPLDFPAQLDTDNRVIPYVLNFKESTSKKAAAQYEGLLDGVKYYFDADGYCYTYDTNGNVIQFEGYQLWMLKDNIDISSGSGVGTRGDTSGTTIFAITSLLPREQIANYALQAILSTIEDPLSMDDAKINYISDLAHKIGFNMTQVASQYREKLNQGEQPPIGGNDEELDQEAETIDQKLVNEIRKIFKETLNIKITEDNVQRDSYGLNISSDVRICNSKKDDKEVGKEVFTVDLHETGKKQDKPLFIQSTYSENNPIIQQLQDLNTKVNTLNQKLEAIDSTLTDIYDILGTTNNTLSSGLSSISTAISNALTSLSNAVTTAQTTANTALAASNNAQKTADAAQKDVDALEIKVGDAADTAYDATVYGAIAVEKARAEGKEAEIKAIADKNKTDITTLNADKNTEGSVDYKIDQAINTINSSTT